MPRTRIRKLLVGAVSLLCLLALALALLGRFFSSEHLAPLVAARLRALFDRPVAVDHIDVGLFSTSIDNIRVSEAETASPDSSWLLLPKVRADLAVLGLLSGRTDPQDLRIDGARCCLQFDQAGHLQTQLPRLAPSEAPFPHISLSESLLVLQEEEHPEFVLTGLTGQFREKGNQLVAEGAVLDPAWGSWTFRGSWDRQSERGSLHLHAPQMHVTEAMLERLPLVPAKVWKQVQCEGDTSVDIELSFERGATRPHYRIVLSPQETHVHISSIDLTAEHARGQLIIEDGVVTLRQVEGQAAGGLLRTEAIMDFRARPPKLQFDIKADQLDLRRLPQKWSFPRLVVQGRLSGQVNLLLTILDGRTRTSGEGTGLIHEARVAGLPLKRPVPVRLYSDGGRLHFGPGGARR
jgi:hypothetical protein